MSTPRKKKEPKRYANEAEIIADIDKTKLKINWLREEADILEQFAVVMRNFPNFATFDSKFVHTGLEYLEKVIRDRDLSNSYENSKLKRLGEALAKMRTGILPLIVEDESIPA